MRPAELIAVARGHGPADLILANARIVNTLTGGIEKGNVAICGDRIAGIGDYTAAKQVIDLQGSYLAPGLIDGHTHIESAMLHPVQYAGAVVPHGTTTLVTDLHEIANVAGLEGMRFVLDCARQLPLEVLLLCPSCVPATPLETSGAEITAEQVRKMLRWKGVLGLGEVMNFPGVINGDGAVLDKIASAAGRVIDGHAPGVTGKDLNAYVAAGIGSDHEATELAEGKEKLERGMWLMIREGSSARNLEALLPLVEKAGDRCMFVVDDRSCYDLLHDGDIDAVVRKAIKLGLDPVRAIQLATMNPARYFRLHDHGAIAPGYVADLIVFSELSGFVIDKVFYRGRLTAQGGELVAPLPSVSSRLTDTVHVRPFGVEALRWARPEEYFPVVEIVPGQIVTRKRLEKVWRDGVLSVPDVSRDVLKLAVVERHRATGNIGLGLVKGFGLKRGALAGSVAHDSHNIIAVGTNDRDIYAAVQEVIRLHGGLVVACDGRVMASLPLSVAGLLSPESAETVSRQLAGVDRQASALGCVLAAPFATLSFLALPVIPELRVTDLGVVDVASFRIV